MRILFYLLPLLFFVPLHAQDTTAAKKEKKILIKPIREYAGDTIKPKGPNEIYFNLEPLLVPLMGGENSWESRFSLMYKRTLKNPRAALRAGIMFRPRNPFLDDDPADWIFMQTDSTRIRNSFYISDIKPLQLNLGMEWRTPGSRRWSAFLALDLCAGFYNRKYQLIDREESLDSTGHWHTSLMNGFTPVAEEKTFNWYEGVSPCAGVRYAFNRKWMFSVQMTVDAYYYNTESFSRDSFGTSLIRSTRSYFDNDNTIHNLISHFDLVYRF